MNDQSASKRTKGALKPTQRSLLREIAVPVLALPVALGLWWWVQSRETPPPSAPPRPSSGEIEVEQDGCIWDEIRPKLEATKRENEAAVERAVMRIDEVFEKYRSGIKPFTEDITDFRTRIGILIRIPGDWWRQDDRINDYVAEKFQKHLYSEEQFIGDISEALQKFREDLWANQNRMLGKVRASVESNDLPGLTPPDVQRYAQEVRSSIENFSSGRAKDSVYQGITTFVAAEVTGIAGYKIVGRVLAPVATSAAAKAVAGGGATVGGATAGGVAGTSVGPVGTAIGAGVGIVVGVIVDWWMTDRFKERLAADLDGYIDDVKSRLLDDSEAGPGLKGTLAKFVDVLSSAQACVMRQSVRGGS